MLKKIWEKLYLSVSLIVHIWEMYCYLIGCASIFGPPAVLIINIMFVFAPLVILNRLYYGIIWLYNWLCSLF